MYLLPIFVHKLGLQVHQISCPLNTYGGAHKGHSLLPKITSKRRNVGANHAVWENNETISWAKSFLSEKMSCAFRKVEIIRNSKQGKLLDTDIN